MVKDQNTELALVNEGKFNMNDQDSIRDVDYPALLNQLSDMLQDSVGYLSIMTRTLTSDEFEEKVMNLQTSPYYEELLHIQTFCKDANKAVAKARNLILSNI